MPSATEPPSTGLTPSDLVSPIRDASRKLVRELGFMRRTLAETNLSPAAVHVLLEIGDHGIHDATELRRRLKLDGGNGSDFDSAVKELVEQGEIAPQSSVPVPGVAKYGLTPQGEETLRGINAFAVTRVQQALGAVAPEEGDAIALGLSLYANVLAATSPAPSQPPAPPRPAVRIESGYRPGFLARALQMHMDYYHPAVDWGRAFETSLAAGFGNLIDRLGENQDNQIWAAVQGPAAPGGKERIVGTILLDAEDLGEEGTAHIRGFIVDEDARGLGAGKMLLRAVMEFVELRGFDKVVLFTMDRLAAAVHLYRSVGFQLESDEEQVVWERPVRVQKFVWRKQRSGESLES